MDIKEVVTGYYGLPVEAITYKTRKREIVRARQISQYFYKSNTRLSLSEIGSEVGGKDHATVLHSCKTINNLIDTEPLFRKEIKEIETLIHVMVNNNPYNFRVGSQVWIIENDKAIEVELSEFFIKESVWKCSKSINGEVVAFYLREPKDIYSINPRERYDVVFIEDIDRLKVNPNSVMNDNYVAFILLKSLNNLKVFELMKSMGMTEYCSPGLVWDNGVKLNLILIATKGEVKLNDVPKTVISSEINLLYTRMKEFYTGRCLNLSGFESDWDRVEIVDGSVKVVKQTDF